MSELTTGTLDAQKSARRRRRAPDARTLQMDGAYPARPADTAARRRALQVKRGVDVVVSLLGLILGLVPLLAIGLAIRTTSPGPVLFRQKRVGRDGRLFEIVKFRTVRADETDPTGLRSIVPDDGRLTGLGQWLRSTGLDELPQLYNVLRGDMSLVGPRPMVDGMLACGRDYRELVPFYAFRQQMTPGLSGLAQVSGYRGTVADERSAMRRIELDCTYIQQFSLGGDLAIIAASTVQLLANIVGIDRGPAPDPT